MRRAVLLAIALLWAPAFAQKPRVHEIALVEGAGSAEGRLKGRGERIYTFDSAGQSVVIEMKAEPVRTLAVELYDPEGARIFLRKEGVGRWSARLSRPGKHELAIFRTAARAPASTYRIRVTVR